MSQQPLPQDRHYAADDVKIVEKSAGYNGFFKVNVYRLQHRLFAGGWNQPIVRELFERGHAAALLPYDPGRDQIVLVEQFRIGAMKTCQTPWLLELVAGIIDEGETAEAVVRREAVEEAGIEVARCEHALSYLVSPGGSTEQIEVYVGEVDASKAKGLHGLADEGEDIRVHVVSREQAYAWLKEGSIDNAASVIALQWLALNHGELRARWLAGIADVALTLQQSRRYVPDLMSLQRTCEVNYMALMKLLPSDGEVGAERRYRVDNDLQFQLTIIGGSRFTSQVILSQHNPELPEYLQAQIEIRLYHDVRMAEVCAVQQISPFATTL